MHHTRFKLSRLALSISLLSGSGMLMPVFAQDANTPTTSSAANDIEVIQVSGIRGSLSKSMDMKRGANGVVDAISAEDMGKFPDTNLAESLQRITGVSIDRQNGEGSKITVRGFGPDFNLVTLNGRQMPSSSLESTSASSSRSFDFANLASEGIAAVEVYKTGRAANSTGGIGATVNILTTRPLNAPGLRGSVGLKGVMDQSTDDGSNITPEISGIFSNTFNDDKFGIALSGSYQERDSGFNQAIVGNGWRAQKGFVPGWGSLPEQSALITNRPGENDVYAVPQNLVYNFNEIERTRTNSQLVLQYRPIDKLTATLDYTYSEHAVASRRSEVSAWFGFDHRESSWTNGPVAGPIIYSENNGGTGDLAMGGGMYATVNENNSIGLNLDYEMSDNLTLELDYHDSDAESRPDSVFGSNAVLGTAAFIRQKSTVDFSQALPVLSVQFGPGIQGIDPSQMVTTGSSFRNSYMRSDIEQVQAKGTYTFDDGIVQSINFGLSSTEVANRSAFSNVQRDTWGGVGKPSDFDPSFWQLDTIADKFDAIPGANNPNLLSHYFKWDFAKVAARAAELYGVPGDNQFWPCGKSFCATDRYTTDRRTVEEAQSAFFQVNTAFDIAARPANLVAGLRYEKTDVTSRALSPVYNNLIWVSANEFAFVEVDSNQSFTELKGDYSHVLPALDFSIEALDDVFLRASYSTTIARPSYGDIQGGLAIFDPRINGGRGSRGNPELKPFESDNFDLSAEWYYEDSSYVSLGLFYKNVNNFIGLSTVKEQPFNLPHPGQGQWAAAARAAGAQTNDEIRKYILDNFANSPDVTVDANGIVQIRGNAARDPAMVFDITLPVNEKDAQLKGYEFALQHVFGDSGFGAIANFTKVNGDIAYDNYSLTEQFALLGLSDSANLVGFYDKDGWQVRISYNWRDKFLASTFDGSGPNPIYTEDYGQWDVSVSYEVMKDLTLSLEGINVTDEYQRQHGRQENMAFAVTQTAPRYNLGVRYKF